MKDTPKPTRVERQPADRQSEREQLRVSRTERWTSWAEKQVER